MLPYLKAKLEIKKSEGNPQTEARQEGTE